MRCSQADGLGEESIDRSECAVRMSKVCGL